MIALIPARAGSKRCPGKHLRLLAGQPLIAYTLAAAQQSGVFADVQVWSDDPAVQQWVAETTSVRAYPRPPSPDDEPDITWVRLALRQQPTPTESFAILRPTSPFRTAATIQRAYRQFTSTECHSLRAVQPVKEHPGKMWEVVGDHMTPLLDRRDRAGTPHHSLPTQTLPAVYVQNASLEMAWYSAFSRFGTISGTAICPFLTEGLEGVDINTEADFSKAAWLAARHPHLLPRVETHVR